MKKYLVLGLFVCVFSHSAFADDSVSVNITASRDNQIDSALVACGMSGTLDQKIADCEIKNLHRSTKSEGVVQEILWKLVSVVQDSDGDALSESWLDSESTLVWGSRLVGSYDFDEAVKICKHQGSGFLLPTADDFRTAEDHGVRYVLKNLGKIYWTRTPSEYPTAAYFYNGSDGYIEDGSKNITHSVRCVGKL